MAGSLSVVGWHEPGSELVEIDGHVPIKITWGRWDPHLESYLYWRTGDLNRSLLEARLVEDAGTLRSVTLLMCRGGVFEQTELEAWPEATALGVPLVAQEAWDQIKYLDSPGHLSVHLGSDDAVISWSPRLPITCVHSGKRVKFGLDSDNRLVALRIMGLSAQERMLLEDTLRR